MAKGPEAQIQAAIIDYLAVERIWHKRMNSGAVVSQYKGKSRMIRYGEAGMADILATPMFKRTDGVHIVVMKFIVPLWIEVKTAKGKQTEAQELFQKEVESQGHFYIIARSIEDVRNFLEAHR